MRHAKGRPGCGPTLITQFPAKVTRWAFASPMIAARPDASATAATLTGAICVLRYQAGTLRPGGR